VAGLSLKNRALTCMSFPEEHCTRIHSTNLLERLNKEVKWRTNVVGIFPDGASVVRLVGAISIRR
jgi:putative transposase